MGPESKIFDHMAGAGMMVATQWGPELQGSKQAGLSSLSPQAVQKK